MKSALPLCVVFSPTTPLANPEKGITETQTGAGGFLQDPWPGLLKTIKVRKTRLKICHSWQRPGRCDNEMHCGSWAVFQEQQGALHGKTGKIQIESGVYST